MGRITIRRAVRDAVLTLISKECVGGTRSTYDSLVFLQHGDSIYFYLLSLSLVYADVACTVFILVSV